MDDEVQDVVGDVKYTDSQKSVTTSNVYSSDFTDSSSDKNQSSGKETYVIDQDDSDDSDKTFHIHEDSSIVKVEDKSPNQNMQRVQSPICKINRPVCESIQCLFVAQEMYTQTSKTIIELAQNETFIGRTLETQTSLVSITENKTVEYTITLTGKGAADDRSGLQIKDNKTNYNTHDFFERNDCNNINVILAKSLEDKSSVFRESEAENENEGNSDNSLDENVIKFIDDESKENISSEIYNETIDENVSDIESSKYNSDVEEDSLNETNRHIHTDSYHDNSSDDSDVPNSVENDVEELYNNLSINSLLQPPPMNDTCFRKFGTLTPLTEETIQKNESIVDVTPSIQTLMKANEEKDSSSLFSSHSRVRVKMYRDYENERGERQRCRLPPIHKDLPCPNSPLVNFLFSNSINSSQSQLYKADTISLRRWEIGTNVLASGESALINGNGDLNRLPNAIQLPPISVESGRRDKSKTPRSNSKLDSKPLLDTAFDTISIGGRIQELKMSNRRHKSKIDSRSGSPTSVSSPEETKMCDAAEKGCDALCTELLRRLRSVSWAEVAETLEYIPKSLENFWSVISENRIADLLRQVTIHIESPRTQVARTACNALAEILKNTNYTKKPDFYEGVATLLTKTSSFSRPVRRAANVALDEIMCNVELTHSVTAICIYGVDHKSPLVRCASARLLVVCCALAEGGRQLLRNRPPTAAAARRHALRALAQLLYDKNLETRKYAERLYSMLRPLPNFEAYFLTDVDVELATRHMKKYDQAAASRQPR